MSSDLFASELHAVLKAYGIAQPAEEIIACVHRRCSQEGTTYSDLADELSRCCKREVLIFSAAETGGAIQTIVELFVRHGRIVASGRQVRIL